MALAVPLRGSRFLVRRGSAFFVRPQTTYGGNKRSIRRQFSTTFGSKDFGRDRLHYRCYRGRDVVIGLQDGMGKNVEVRLSKQLETDQFAAPWVCSHT